MRIGFVPEVRIPHLKARSFNWASLRVLGSENAIHDIVVYRCAERRLVIYGGRGSRREAVVGHARLTKSNLKV